MSAYENPTSQDQSQKEQSILQINFEYLEVITCLFCATLSIENQFEPVGAEGLLCHLILLQALLKSRKLLLQAGNSMNCAVFSVLA